MNNRHTFTLLFQPFMFSIINSVRSYSQSLKFRVHSKLKPTISSVSTHQKDEIVKTTWNSYNMIVSKLLILWFGKERNYFKVARNHKYKITDLSIPNSRLWSLIICIYPCIKRIIILTHQVEKIKEVKTKSLWGVFSFFARKNFGM